MFISFLLFICMLHIYDWIYFLKIISTRTYIEKKLYILHLCLYVNDLLRCRNILPYSTNHIVQSVLKVNYSFFSNE